MFEELLNKYISSFEQKSDDIKKALESENFQELFSIVHKISGSSGSYGVVSVSKQSALLEALFKDQNTINDNIVIESIELIRILRKEQQKYL